MECFGVLLLLREHWDLVDRAIATEVVTTDLLSQVEFGGLPLEVEVLPLQAMRHQLELKANLFDTADIAAFRAEHSDGVSAVGTVALKVGCLLTLNEHPRQYVLSTNT